MRLSTIDNSFLLAANTTYNPSLNKYATGMNFVDQINIFDIRDPDASFSVTTSKNRYATSEIENMPMPDKMEYYYDLRSTDALVFGLYANQNRKDWAMENNPASIHVFDWQGNAVAELFTKEKITHFDIDHINNRLYGVNMEEELFVYDLPDL
jgi:hypothetical protein